MPSKQILVSAINIVAKRHEPEVYRDLWLAAFKAGLYGKLRGDRSAVIGSAKPDDNASFIEGDIFTFVDIDFDQPWLNIEERQEASDEDLKNIEIPENLKPGLRSFVYFFDLKRHQVIFESRNESRETLTPSLFEKALSGIFSHNKIADRFGEIHVTTIPKEDALEKVLSLPRLGQLDLVISPPNPDDNDDLESTVLDRMRRRNVGREQTRLTAESRTTSIQPDEDLQALAQVAARNGYVKSRGSDSEGLSIEESTKKYPMKEAITFDDQISSARKAVLSFLRRLTD